MVRFFFSFLGGGIHRGSCYIGGTLFCWRERTATAALLSKTCVFICLVSVGMPGGNCSMNGMLVVSCEGNSEDNGSMWRTLKCFACSLHGCAPQHSCIDSMGKLELGALKKHNNSPHPARIPKTSHSWHFTLRHLLMIGVHASKLN